MATKYDANGYNSQGRRKIIGVKKGPDEFQEAARGLEDSGFKVKNGQLTPTQDYGQMVGLASEQRNSLSRDAKPGSISTLGSPLGSMYAANPGFFKRGPSGGAAVSPELGRAQNIAKAKEAGTFDIIRDQFNAKGGAQMNEFGTIGAAAPAPAPTAESVAAQRASIQGAAAPAMAPAMAPAAAPAAAPDPNKPQSSEWLTENRPVQFYDSGLPKLPWAGDTAESGQRTANRQALEQRAAGLNLMKEAQQSPMQVTEQGGGKNLVGKYGTGWSAPATAGAKRSEGLVNGRPFSEVMQGLANKQGNLGTSRPTDKFQPQTGGNALYDKSAPSPTKDDINKQRTSLAASKR